MKRTFILLTALLTTVSAFAQDIGLPLDFEAADSSYVWNDFAGGVASVVANPQADGINTSAQVGQMIKYAGEVYGGSTLPFSAPLSFGDNNAVKMKVLANRADAPVLFKLEGANPIEISMNTTVANEWEELVFDFSGFTELTFTAVTIIYDLGVVGDGGDNFTLYFDDIETTMIESEGGGIQLPIDFEAADSTYSWSDFAGGVASVVANPQADGINTSAQVGQMVKFAGEVYGGSTLALGAPLDFGDNNAIKMKVLANRADAPVLFKLEGANPIEISMNTTVANEWEELVFDFSGFTELTFTAITIIYDLGVVGDGGDNFTLYFDDIEATTLEGGGGGVQLPIDFEATDLDYNWSDFAGGVASIIDNPQATGSNTSAKVGQMVKFAGEVYGGSTLALGAPLDFGDNNAIKMKVLANRADAPVLFKLEGPSPVEVTMNTTVANEWEELVFDFSGSTDLTFTAITIIYDLGVVGDGGADFTLLFDDIEATTLEGSGGGVQLPIDFEATDLDYNWSDFAGGVASIIDNPQATGSNTSAKVGQMVKFAGEVYGGSTLALGAPLDFGTATAISMKVFANRVGAPVLFKLEGPSPVEVTMNTTVANEWEELVFDFSGSTDLTFTAITIIYDLGVVGDGGADFTLLFDDITLATATGVSALKQLDVQFYPNPVQEVMTVTAPEVIRSIRVYNLNGQQMLLSQPDNETVNMNLANLTPGTYVIQVQLDGQQGVATFVKH